MSACPISMLECFVLRRLAGAAIGHRGAVGQRIRKAISATDFSLAKRHRLNVPSRAMATRAIISGYRMSKYAKANFESA